MKVATEHMGYMQLLDKVPVVNIKPTLYQYQHYVFKNQCCQNKNLVL